MVGIAQLVEQRTENPRVTSSNLVPGIGLINLYKFLFFKLNVSLFSKKKVQSSFIPLFFCSCCGYIRSKRMLILHTYSKRKVKKVL